MQNSNRIRLDIHGFQKTKRAGVLLLALVVVGVLFSTILFAWVQNLATYYMRVDEYAISSSAMLEKILGSKKPIAIMFESPTCPTCKRMHPYWAMLEYRSDKLPISFFHIVYGSSTEEAFRKYHVTETPTFIVFVEGEPVARHVGPFGGENVTDTMLNWALFSAGLSRVSDPQKLAEEGLRIFNSRCSACHGKIGGLDKASLQTWLESRDTRADLLARRLNEALEKNMTLRELYGSYGRISDTVKSMRKYIPDLSSYEIDRLAYLLDYVSAVLEDREPPAIVASANATLAASIQQNSSNGDTALDVGGAISTSLVGVVAALVAGIIATFSPCVFPLLVAYVSAAGTSGRKISASSCIVCGIAAFTGVIAIGLLFVLASSLVSSLQSVLLPTVAAAVVAAGVAGLLGIPIELEGVVGVKRSGLVGFCAVYGFLAVQCSLPLVAGTLLLVVGVGSLVSSIAVAVSFALGVSVPLAFAVYAASRLGSSMVNKVVGRYTLLQRIGGLVLVAAGVYLLLHTLQLV